MEADEGEKRAEALGPTAETGREDQAADLTRAARVGAELERDMRLPELEVLAVERAPARLQVDVRPPLPRHAAEDRAGTYDFVGLAVLEYEHELALADVVDIAREALAAAPDLRGEELFVCGEVDEVNHLRELQERRKVVEDGWSNDEHRVYLRAARLRPCARTTSP